MCRITQHFPVYIQVERLQWLIPELQSIICVQQRSSTGRRQAGQQPYLIRLRQSRQEVQNRLQPPIYASYFPADQRKYNLRPRGQSSWLPANQSEASEHQTGPPESKFSWVIAASQRPLPWGCRIGQPARSHGQRPRPSRATQCWASARAELTVNTKQRYTLLFLPGERRRATGFLNRLQVLNVCVYIGCSVGIQREAAG